MAAADVALAHLREWEHNLEQLSLQFQYGEHPTREECYCARKYRYCGFQYNLHNPEHYLMCAFNERLGSNKISL